MLKRIAPNRSRGRLALQTGGRLLRPDSKFADVCCLKKFQPQKRYLIGISGGRDSVALLHWLLRQGYSRLVVCHLDHGSRGSSSRADARFVQRLAAKWKLPVEVDQADVAALAKATKQSFETAGRAARLAFFAKVARRRRCSTVFLGHHADDQVETFLMRLFRGAGARGLGAMRETSQVGSLQIVRPLLGVWRSEVDNYIAEHGLKFREDASNADLGIRRNQLRHQMVPELEKQFGRNLRPTLWRAASILAEESAFLDSIVPNDALEGNSLDVRKLAALPRPLRRRAILRWLQGNAVSDIGYEAVERIDSLLATDGRISKVNLPGDRHARRRAGKIFLE